jgi:hypothetical protein
MCSVRPSLGKYLGGSIQHAMLRGCSHKPAQAQYDCCRLSMSNQQQTRQPQPRTCTHLHQAPTVTPSHGHTDIPIPEASHFKRQISPSTHLDVHHRLNTHTCHICQTPHPTHPMHPDLAGRRRRGFPISAQSPLFGEDARAVPSRRPVAGTDPSRPAWPGISAHRSPHQVRPAPRSWRATGSGAPLVIASLPPRPSACADAKPTRTTALGLGRELGLTLPAPGTPKANYTIACWESPTTLYVSGHLPIK